MIRCRPGLANGDAQRPFAVGRPEHPASPPDKRTERTSGSGRCTTPGAATQLPPAVDRQPTPAVAASGRRQNGPPPWPRTTRPGTDRTGIQTQVPAPDAPDQPRSRYHSIASRATPTAQLQPVRSTGKGRQQAISTVVIALARLSHGRSCLSGISSDARARRSDTGMDTGPLLAATNLVVAQ